MFGPDGNLYVADYADGVLRYDGTTGAYLDTFAAGDGLPGGHSLIFLPEPFTGILTLVGFALFSTMGCKRN